MNSRLERLQKRLPKLYVDAFLVTDQTNIRYLTGFNLLQGDGFLLVTGDRAIIVTDARYQLALEEFASDEVVATISQDYYHDLDRLCQALQVTVLGYEATIPYQLYDLLDEIVTADLVPFNQLVEKMRMVKDSTELIKMQRAADLHTAGFQYLLEHVRPGVSERHLANLLDFWMKEHGATGWSFPPIVASGVNAAKPHATASEKLLVDGEILTVDFGYFVDGYTADLTRTVAIGSIDPELRDVYEIVNTARQAVIDRLHVGIHGDKLDAAGRQLIEEAGYGDEFNHGMGHGIGLGVHELPASYGPGTKQVQLVNNEVITVEPGIYIPEIGGVRIEDDVVVTHGGSQILTTAPTDLIIVGD